MHLAESLNQPTQRFGRPALIAGRKRSQPLDMKQEQVKVAVKETEQKETKQEEMKEKVKKKETVKKETVKRMKDLNMFRRSRRRKPVRILNHQVSRH